MELLKPILRKLDLKYQPQTQLLSFVNFLIQSWQICKNKVQD